MRRRTMTGKTVVREGKAEIDTTIRAVLRDVLGLSAERAASFRDATPLFGALPELDSMAVAGVPTEIEDRLGILIDDDEVDGEIDWTRDVKGKGVSVRVVVVVAGIIKKKNTSAPRCAT